MKHARVDLAKSINAVAKNNQAPGFTKDLMKVQPEQPGPGSNPGQKENPHPFTGGGLQNKSLIEGAASRGKWAATLKKLYKSMQNASKSQTWYNFSTKPGAAMAARKEAISRYRSPGTIADEILRIISWGVQPLLLVFCTTLSFSSYQAFFSHNFSPLFATIGALILSVVIEMGKIKIGGYVFQVPFLSGTQVLRSSFAVFAVWFGALLITGATFYMSVINSTKGAAMLAQKVGFEKNEAVFTPNTADIDKQLDEANQRATAALSVKWKQHVTYQAQQSLKTESRTIAKLQEQREQAIKTQRADFERRRAQMDTNTNTGANILMAAGGWVEALQAICLFLIAACMAAIDKVMTDEQPAAKPTAANINGPLAEFTRNGQNFNNRSTIGFHWDGYGEAPPTPSKGVTHLDTGVTHIKSDGVLRLAMKDFGSWAANIGSKRHDNGNAHAHISRILDQLRYDMKQEGFSPTLETGYKAYKYFFEKLNTLAERGWGYDHAEEILKELAQKIPSQGPQFTH